MKKLRFRLFIILILLVIACFALLTGCSSAKLSSSFKEDEVIKAAENVITLINKQDSENLKQICTVQMKDALTDDVLKKINAAISECGKFLKVEEIRVASKTDKASKEEFAVVIVKAKYEIKTIIYTISFTKQMKLAGLYYK